MCSCDVLLQCAAARRLMRHELAAAMCCCNASPASPLRQLAAIMYCRATHQILLPRVLSDGGPSPSPCRGGSWTKQRTAPASKCHHGGHVRQSSLNGGRCLGHQEPRRRQEGVVQRSNCGSQHITHEPPAACNVPHVLSRFCSLRALVCWTHASFICHSLLLPWRSRLR